MNEGPLYLVVFVSIIVVVALGFYIKFEITGMATVNTLLTIQSNGPIMNLTNITATEGSTINISNCAYDPDLDPITCFFPAPFDSNGIWDLSYNDEGTYYFTINATDGEFNATITIRVLVIDIPCTLLAKLNPDQFSIDLTWGSYHEGNNYTNYTVYYTGELLNGSFNYSDAVSFNTTNTSWTDTSANLVQKRYYRVGGYNATDKNDCNLTVGKFDINLTTDYGQWNYISLPFIPNNFSRDYVLQNILGNVDYVYYYNNEDGGFNVYTYRYGGLGTVDAIYPGESYMILPTDNVTLTNVGELFTNVMSNLTTNYGGWNYIGWVNEITDRDVGMDSVLGDIDYIYYYNSTNGGFVVWSFEYEVGDISRLYPGTSYIILAADNTSLDYSMYPK